jgi:Fe-S-cluster containining protein
MSGLDEEGPPPTHPAADRHGEAWYAEARALAAALERTPERARLPLLATRLPVLHAHQDAFVREVLEASPAQVTCGPGCAACCRQWVAGVHAHEVALLGRHVLEARDPRAVRARLAEDVAAYEGLRPETHPAAARATDPEEARAVAYLALERPCVFLGDDERCTVHALRPSVCRGYFSLSAPERCAAPLLLEPGTRTFQLEPHHRATEALNHLDSALPAALHTTQRTTALVRALLTFLDAALAERDEPSP